MRAQCRLGTLTDIYNLFAETGANSTYWCRPRSVLCKKWYLCVQAGHSGHHFLLVQGFSFSLFPLRSVQEMVEAFDCSTVRPKPLKRPFSGHWPSSTTSDHRPCDWKAVQWCAHPQPPFPRYPCVASSVLAKHGTPVLAKQ